MIIKLTNHEVETKEGLTFGQSMELAKTLGDSSFENIINAQYVLIQMVVVKITDGDKIIPYSKEWVDNLPKEDGEKLVEEINNSVNKKKV